MKEGVTIRDITNEECHWITNTIPMGTIVKEYMDCTYGCVSEEGVAVVLPDTDYFIEIPLNAVRW